MKRIAWRKVFLVFALMGALVYLAYVFIYNESADNKVLCKSIAVEISNSNDVKLVSVEDVRDIVKTCGIPVLNKSLDQIPVDKLQKLLASKSYIKTVYVYTTGDGALNVKLEQRKPVVRFNTRQASFFMDESGYVFPLSNTYSPYLPLVTGDIDLPFSATYKGPLGKGAKADFLMEMLSFAMFVQQDEFWNAEIQQINVAKSGDVELITCTGDFAISLGGLNNYEYKLNKLLTFYKKALPVERWDKYKSLDLRYSNQVVATLK